MMSRDESKSYAFRLNPSKDEDRDVIEIIEELQAKGFSVRAIVSNAIVTGKHF